MEATLNKVDNITVSFKGQKFIVPEKTKEELNFYDQQELTVDQFFQILRLGFDELDKEKEKEIIKNVFSSMLERR
jgi:hypothetical protein|tara:strand:- start:160 stop:384 length:225 start_codon:yes stop_codon:yes gene_type:complete